MKFSSIYVDVLGEKKKSQILSALPVSGIRTTPLPTTKHMLIPERVEKQTVGRTEVQQERVFIMTPL
jgi:hypothetical protein